MDKRFLVLADGTVYEGRGFGAPAIPVEALDGELAHGVGEVVFNTAMSGYHEVLTDPSYTGQIVAMTYPHVGNYGDLDVWSEIGPESGTERPLVKVAGLVARRVYTGPVPEGRETLHDFLGRTGTPGITEVDTRALTLKLRDGGSLNGVITVGANGGLTDSERSAAIAFVSQFPDMVGRNLIGTVGSRSPDVMDGHGGPTVAVIDCGSKANILRILEQTGCRICLFPSTVDAADILAAKPDAVLVTNGPGDPAVLTRQIGVIADLIGRLPVFGICLGHQLICEALGARTYKMPFGHHGVNHPVRDETTGRVFVTSQNHGFAVDETGLPAGASVWFRNANDRTIEGIRNDELKVMTAQFHPESAPGPHDSRWIFDAFLDAI